MFIPTTSEPPVWESKDAQKLREFLDTETGRRALSSLAFQVPVLLDGTDVNKTLVASGVVRGWTDSISAILSLLTIQPEQPKAPETYPSIDDDKHWEDGKTPQ